jgi:hypothetical protein
VTVPTIPRSTLLAAAEVALHGRLVIRYSCHVCGLEKVEASVRYRASEEDLIAWMKEVVTPALCADHDARSPHCHPDGLSDVLIPIDGAEWIGGPAVQ